MEEKVPSADKHNIPVVCTNNRSEDVNLKKPRGIHVNPKFFKNVEDFSQPHHDPRMQALQPYSFRPPIPQRSPPRHFIQDQRWGFQPFQTRNNFQPQANRPNRQFHCGPGPPSFVAPQLPFQNFPPPPRGAYHYGEHQQNPFQPFNNNFYGHPGPTPQFRGGIPFQSTNGPWDVPPNSEPMPGPSYYGNFNNYDLPWKEGRNMERLPNEFEQPSQHCSPDWRKEARLRSVSSDSSRCSDTSEKNRVGSRRSRSLTPRGAYRDSRNSSRSGYSSRSSESDDTMWNSDYERNSDSDLDLSKPLTSLTENVANSRSLLKDALKCVDRSKFDAMMPVELKRLSRKRLLQLCEQLLDETDNEELLRVMEGKQISLAEVGSPKAHTDDAVSSSQSEPEVVHMKKSHKKKSKRKRKHKGQGARSTNSQEFDSDVLSVSTEDSSASEESAPKETQSKTQQSLLELIQIEYKTKAINVMLKNLGVASEISTLVSNAITGGQQNIVNILKENLSAVTETSCSSSSHSLTIDEKNVMNFIVQPTESPVKGNLAKSNPQLNICDSTDKTDDIDGDADTEHDNTADGEFDESELLKDTDNDVLDLDVGANDKFNLPD